MATNAASAPSRIALGMGQALRCNHHVPNGGLRPTRKDAADARSARDWRRPYKQSTVRSNRSNDITYRGGKDEQLCRNFSHEDSILGTKCAVSHQHDEHPEQDAQAIMSATSRNDQVS
jgi:hypothetical protein